MLLIGGDKTGNARWYDIFVPIADRLYDAHIAQLQREKKEETPVNRKAPRRERDEKERKMAKPFKELESKMSKASIARSDEKAKVLREEMALNELRAAMEITQEHLAGRLHVNQAAISKLERRTDMYVSTLADFIQAMGGKLEITARFPEGVVRINQFRELRRSGTRKGVRLTAVAKR